MSDDGTQEQVEPKKGPTEEQLAAARQKVEETQARNKFEGIVRDKRSNENRRERIEQLSNSSLAADAKESKLAADSVKKTAEKEGEEETLRAVSEGAVPPIEIYTPIREGLRILHYNNPDILYARIQRYTERLNDQTIIQMLAVNGIEKEEFEKRVREIIAAIDINKVHLITENNDVKRLALEELLIERHYLSLKTRIDLNYSQEEISSGAAARAMREQIIREKISQTKKDMSDRPGEWGKLNEEEMNERAELIGVGNYLALAMDMAREQGGGDEGMQYISLGAGESASKIGEDDYNTLKRGLLSDVLRLEYMKSNPLLTYEQATDQVARFFVLAKSMTPEQATAVATDEEIIELIDSLHVGNDERKKDLKKWIKEQQQRLKEAPQAIDRSLRTGEIQRLAQLGSDLDASLRVYAEAIAKVKKPEDINRQISELSIRYQALKRLRENKGDMSAAITSLEQELKNLQERYNLSPAEGGQNDDGTKTENESMYYQKQMKIEVEMEDVVNKLNQLRTEQGNIPQGEELEKQLRETMTDIEAHLMARQLVKDGKRIDSSMDVEKAKSTVLKNLSILTNGVETSMLKNLDPELFQQIQTMPTSRQMRAKLAFLSSAESFRKKKNLMFSILAMIFVEIFSVATDELDASMQLISRAGGGH
jgi:hypothetical protein